MNMKTMLMALGVAGVLLVAGLAAVFSSTPLSDLMNNSNSREEGSNNLGGDGSDEIPDTIVTDPEDTHELPSEPIPVSNDPSPAEAVQGEPNLWMEYTTNWGGDSISYGMPYPSANQFTIETNEYGEDQPEGDYQITHFIHITDVAPRSGNVGDPEGTVEIRTYNPNSAVSRLVNLYDDGEGGCYGILVDTFSTWDYTWTFEHGKSAKFTQTFSINITALGSHTIDVYAIHDHGDGSYKVVSNHLTRTFTTQASSVIDTRIESPLGNSLDSSYYLNSPIDFQVSVQRGTYQSNIHGNLPYTYSHDVKVRLFVEGTSGYSLKMNGNAISGVSTTYERYGTTYVGTMYELGSWSADSLSGADYSLSITFTDGKSHQMFAIGTDMPSGEPVGFGSVGFWYRTW
jgi:hypothetical protein